jgi:hypothetical protein
LSTEQAFEAEGQYRYGAAGPGAPEK